MIVKLMFHENAVNAYDENAESILLLLPSPLQHYMSPIKF